MSGTIHVEEDRNRHVCTITIDNPEKRNALSPDFLPAMITTFEEIEPDPDIRTVVLTGAGDRSFCSGYDLDAVTDSETRQRHMRRLITVITNHDYPTIAKINGDAIGGGFNLVTACDLRVAVEEARFGLTPAKIGLVYPDDGILNSIQTIGAANTKELLFTADLIDANRATEMGLLNRLVSRGELDETTAELATTVSANAPLSLTGMKRIVRAIQRQHELSDIEREWVRQLQHEAEQSRDHEEGLQAMTENRIPEFEGE